MATVQEMIEKLEERFIFDEISEEAYNDLKAKLELRLHASQAHTSSSQQASSDSQQSFPDFSDMYMSGNPDGYNAQESNHQSVNHPYSSSSGSGGSSGSEWQVDAGMQLQLGEQYTIKKYLSRGGFGSVYQARDSLRDKEVALKVIFPELDKADSALKQLINEYDSRSRISNRRHILEVSTPMKFTFKNLDVIVLPMELAVSGNLRDYLTNKPADISDADWEKQSIHFFKEACGGVKAIHQAGFTHQDIKPDNLLICKDPDTGKQILKVADFGLAKAKNKVKGLKRGAGTPAYMSPEQFYRRAKDIMPDSDVYALGCVLFELLDGDPPIEASTPEEYARLHKEQVPFLKRIPKKYQPVINKCLAKDSDARYKDAGELLEAIEEIPRLEEAKRHAEAKRKAEAAEKLRREAEARLEAEKRRRESEARKWESFSGGRFLRHRDTKIIQDKKTGLEWLVGPDKDTTHYEAQNWVDSLYDGWRLPTSEELEELKLLGESIKRKLELENCLPLFTPEEIEAEIAKAKEKKLQLYSKEGTNNDWWILLDFIDTVLHIFSYEARNYYKIEEIFDKTKQIKQTANQSEK